MLEILEGLQLYGHVCEVGLTEERVNHDRDEQVEEHLRYNQLEEYVEEEAERCAAANGTQRIVWVAPIRHNRVECFVLAALEKYRMMAGRVEHDGVPGLASRTAEQGEERGAKGLEVGVAIHLTRIFNVD